MTDTDELANVRKDMIDDLDLAGTPSVRPYGIGNSEKNVQAIRSVHPQVQAVLAVRYPQRLVIGG